MFNYSILYCTALTPMLLLLLSIPLRECRKAKSAIRKLQEGSTKLVKNAVRNIPPFMWYTALPQLTSR